MDEAVSTATEKEASLPLSSSIPEDPHSQSLSVADSSVANSAPTTAESIPGTTNSMPCTANFIPDITDSILDTENSLPNTEPVSSVPTTSTKIEDVTPNPDPILETPNQDTEFIDYMYQPDPLEKSTSLQQRDTESRRAATSFSISGADPIANSGDHAIDSDDVTVLPEATENNELEISHLVHDWIDKVFKCYSNI